MSPSGSTAAGMVALCGQRSGTGRGEARRAVVETFCSSLVPTLTDAWCLSRVLSTSEPAWRGPVLSGVPPRRSASQFRGVWWWHVCCGAGAHPGCPLTRAQMLCAGSRSWLGEAGFVVLGLARTGVWALIRESLSFLGAWWVTGGVGLQALPRQSAPPVPPAAVEGLLWRGKGAPGSAEAPVWRGVWE